MDQQYLATINLNDEHNTQCHDDAMYCNTGVLQDCHIHMHTPGWPQ